MLQRDGVDRRRGRAAQQLGCKGDDGDLQIRRFNLRERTPGDDPSTFSVARH
jgi:hypothetical protein